MKKMMITFAITAALLSLTACSGSSTADSAAETTTTVTEQTTDQTSEQTTEETTVQTTNQTTEQTTTEKPADKTVATATTAGSAEQTTTTAKETAGTKEAVTTTTTTAGENKEMRATAEALMKEYCHIIDGYGIGAPDKCNYEDSVPDKEPYLTYYRVTEAPFDSVQGVKDYLAKYLTSKEYDNFIDQLFGDAEHPLYKEVGGKLYCCPMNKGAEILDVQWDTVKVSDVTDNSATATVTEISYGGMHVDLIFKLKRENGVFKIAEYSWKEQQ